MKKLLLLFLLFFLLQSCVTVVNLKIDVSGKTYLYSIRETVDMSGLIPKEIKIQFHSEFELFFDIEKCLFSNTNYVTVGSKVASRVYEHNVFKYQIFENKIILSNGMIFDIVEFGLLWDFDGGKILFRSLS